MKHLLYILFLLPSFVIAQQGIGPMTYRVATPDDIVVCPHSNKYQPNYSPRKKVDKNLKSNAAQFVPRYTTSVPQDFRDAMEFVFETASTYVSSNIPIHVSVDYEELADGVLAAAGPGGYASNFPGALYYDTNYPIALAEKLAGEPLNADGSADIVITINSRDDINWNTIPGNQAIGNRFDLASVLLHELFHGLGFIAGSGVNGTDGFINALIYSRFLENKEEVNLLEGVENNSNDMRRELTGGELFFDNPETENERYDVYAPAAYSDGSSISHLDRAAYQGTEHRLMISSIGRGDVNYNAGHSGTILSLMGWNSTSLLHEPEFFSATEETDEDYLVTAKINADIGFDTSSLVFHYSTDSFNIEDIVVPMEYDESTNEYSFNLPATGESFQYQYYFEYKESTGRTQLVPARANEYFFTYDFGLDNTAPIIAGHVPVESIKETDTELTIKVNDLDDYFTGVDTSSLAMIVSLNGNLETVPFEVVEGDFGVFFEASYESPNGFEVTDELAYRIVVSDLGIQQNQGSLPLEGFFPVAIEEVSAAVVTYVNDFDSESDDFVGSGFSIDQPLGFRSPAIHSEHPYENAGTGSTLNFIYELKQLIRIDEDNPIIRFNEIVLVEIGDPGTACRRAVCPLEFWDYVVVEGSIPGSGRWLALHDAYDSRDDSAFASAYRASRNGSPSLYKLKEISLIENGSFEIGDEIFIRFRLFSDPFAVGWGWAIDNLEIQPMSTNTLEEEYVNSFELYPNPIDKDQILTININLAESLSGQLSLVNVQGQKLINHQLQNSQSVNVNWDLSTLTPGIYFAQLQNELGTSVRKIVVE